MDFIERLISGIGQCERGETLYHVGLSGGKDSTALLLWMIYESGIPPHQVVVSFCDTQNEAEGTYQHLRLLNRRVFPVVWLQTEGFLHLALRKKRFPSTKARFCTQELKLKPTKAFIDSMLSDGYDVIAVSGVRRAESAARAKLSEWGDPMESYFGVREWRPLIEWSFDDVLALHEKYDVPLNPLYYLGAQRVGCFPCINSSKAEMRALARNFPERVEQIREWEQSFDTPNGISTFFSPNTVPARFRSVTVETKNGQKRVATIDDVVEWAKSGWRAKGLHPDEASLFDGQLRDEPVGLCLSQSLACE